MSQKNFLQRIIIKLESAGIPYMISGSFGSSFYGKPRATNDIDLVISPTKKQLDNFIQSLGDDYYVSQEAASDAFLRRSMFNVIDIETGWKADLIILKNRPFSLEEFNRRRKSAVAGVTVDAVSPEDAILSKLEWAKISESDRQFQDALGVAVVQWNSLDKEYLRKWAQELEVEDLLERLFQNVEEANF